jgi:acyl-coenzyme A thioesterase PaaI-like protein
VQAADTPKTLALYRRFAGFPGGRWLFTRAVCWRAPYFASVRPSITELAPGYCEVRIANRRRVRNHLGTVHAIAMANMCELAAGLATEVTIPTSLRWIPRGMTIEYLKKAGSNLRAVCQLGEAPAWRDGLELTMPVLVLDASDTPVVQAHIRMWVTARKRG